MILGMEIWNSIANVSYLFSFWIDKRVKSDMQSLKATVIIFYIMFWSLICWNLLVDAGVKMFCLSRIYE